MYDKNGEEITEYAPRIIKKKEKNDRWEPEITVDGKMYEEFMFLQWFTGKTMVKVKYWLVDDIDVIHQEAIKKFDLKKEGKETSRELKRRMDE